MQVEDTYMYWFLKNLRSRSKSRSHDLSNHVFKKQHNLATQIADLVCVYTSQCIHSKLLFINYERIHIAL